MAHNVDNRTSWHHVMNNARLAHVKATCETLTATNVCLDACLAPSLREHVTAGRFHQGQLFVYATSAAWLTRLRFELPAVEAMLRKQPTMRGLQRIVCRILRPTPELRPQRRTVSQPSAHQRAEKHPPLTQALQAHAARLLDDES